MTIKKLFIWAHRGASGHEVDNTLESFELALKMGADGLESDVHQSKDGVLIFFHDEKVNWNGKDISPTKLTIKQIKSINLGNGRKIPLVEDIFKHFKDKTNKYGEKIRYSLDVKKISYGIPLIEIAKKIGVADKVEITPNDNYPSFWRYVREFRNLSADINIVDSAHFELKPLKILFKKMFYQNWNKFKRFNVKGINIKADYATVEMIDMITSHDLKLYVWDCHDKIKLKKFLSKNIDAIYTNYPDLACKIRDEL